MGRRLRLGLRGPLPSPEDALKELAEGPAPDAPEGDWPRLVWGSPDRVRAKLDEMAQALGLEELMAVTITYDHAARVRSYELLAQAYGLQGRG
jgi:alkanesulfonate monooxygenase SsuD/methylene tetrahydromethanopterin reductase-like flavin-dependent oxidoreductase (luciferase family)